MFISSFFKNIFSSVSIPDFDKDASLFEECVTKGASIKKIKDKAFAYLQKNPNLDAKIRVRAALYAAIKVKDSQAEPSKVRKIIDKIFRNTALADMREMHKGLLSDIIGKTNAYVNNMEACRKYIDSFTSKGIAQKSTENYLAKLATLKDTDLKYSQISSLKTLLEKEYNAYIECEKLRTSIHNNMVVLNSCDRENISVWAKKELEVLASGPASYANQQQTLSRIDKTLKAQMGGVTQSLEFMLKSLQAMKKLSEDFSLSLPLLLKLPAIEDEKNPIEKYQKTAALHKEMEKQALASDLKHLDQTYRKCQNLNDLYSSYQVVKSEYYSLQLNSLLQPGMTLSEKVKLVDRTFAVLQKDPDFKQILDALKMRMKIDNWIQTCEAYAAGSAQSIQKRLNRIEELLPPKKLQGLKALHTDLATNADFQQQLGAAEAFARFDRQMERVVDLPGFSPTMHATLHELQAKHATGKEGQEVKQTENAFSEWLLVHIQDALTKKQDRISANLEMAKQFIEQKKGNGSVLLAHPVFASGTKNVLKSILADEILAKDWESTCRQKLTAWREQCSQILGRPVDYISLFGAMVLSGGEPVLSQLQMIKDRMDPKADFSVVEALTQTIHVMDREGIAAPSPLSAPWSFSLMQQKQFSAEAKGFAQKFLEEKDPVAKLKVYTKTLEQLTKKYLGSAYVLESNEATHFSLMLLLFADSPELIEDILGIDPRLVSLQQPGEFSHEQGGDEPWMAREAKLAALCQAAVEIGFEPFT